jgi:hypothetical protein
MLMGFNSNITINSGQSVRSMPVYGGRTYTKREEVFPPKEQTLADDKPLS